MPHPYAWMGAAVFGVIAAVVLAIHEHRRRQHNNGHRNQFSTCCICGQRISANPYVSTCGHQFHRHCYADKLLDHGDRGGRSSMPCPSCGYSSNNTSAESPSEGTRRRITLRRDFNASNSSRVTQNSRDSGGNNTKCSNCDMPFGSSDRDRIQRDCGHAVHDKCASISQFVRCTNCPGSDEAL